MSVQGSTGVSDFWFTISLEGWEEGGGEGVLDGIWAGSERGGGGFSKRDREKREGGLDLEIRVTDFYI